MNILSTQLFFCILSIWLCLRCTFLYCVRMNKSNHDSIGYVWSFVVYRPYSRMIETQHVCCIHIILYIFTWKLHNNEAHWYGKASLAPMRSWHFWPITGSIPSNENKWKFDSEYIPEQCKLSVSKQRAAKTPSQYSPIARLECTWA